MILNPKLLKGTVLFKNENGQADAPLKKSPFDFKRLEIEYADSGLENVSHKTIYISDYKENNRFWLDFFLFDSTGNAYSYSNGYLINTDGIVLNRAGSLIVSTANEIHINKTNSVRITKVTGYNY